MSQPLNSLDLTDRALATLNETEGAVFELHAFTKAILAILEDEGFLDIVEPINEEDG